MLARLKKAIEQHCPDKKTGRAAKIEPSIVRTIYMSIFGFSRGASEARVFLNWLKSLCELDAHICGANSGPSLGGFRVEFDFLGIFDTVASVGLANTTGSFHGHGAWADTEDSLRVPSDVKCLHLIAAHEPRRSFPVDSVSVKGFLPEGCEEIVVPGAHSDIGGGYGPCEQGRGTDRNGNDMLSRIPLIMMYRAARLNGVPLKLELATASTKEKFLLDNNTIDVFNAYIRSCRVMHGPIHRIMREQMQKQIEWRIFRRLGTVNSLERSASFLRTSKFHQNDLHSACKDFLEEIEDFNKWVQAKGSEFKPAPQMPGFKNGHESEWEEISTWWFSLQNPNADVLRFFDEYVHDSRAGFKLSKIDSEKAMHDYLKGLVNLTKQRIPVLTGKADFKSPRDLMSTDERRAAEEYERTGKIPRMYVGWREPWKTPLGFYGRAGYLRFRRIYGGFDSDFIS